MLASVSADACPIDVVRGGGWPPMASGSALRCSGSRLLWMMLPSCPMVSGFTDTCVGVSSKMSTDSIGLSCVVCV